MTKIVHSLASLNDKLATYACRNLLINGDFSVWQRGEDIGVVGAAFFADMWKGSSAGFKGVKRTTEPSIIGGAFVECSDGASNTKTIKNAIELKVPGNAGPFQIGAKVAVSFKVKSNANNSEVNFELSFRDGYDGNNVVLPSPGDNVSVPSANLWYDVSGVVTIDQAPAGTNTALVLTLTGENVDINMSLSFADVQLEMAEVPTAIEEIPIATQMARCQRYCVVFPQYSIINGYTDASSTAAQALVGTFTPLRTSPAFEGTPSFSAFFGDGTSRDTMTIDTILYTYPGPLRLKFIDAGLPTNNVVSLRFKAAAVLSADL